jgi:HEAT repeat protein
MILVSSPPERTALAEALGSVAEDENESLVHESTVLLSSLGSEALPTYEKLFSSESPQTRLATIRSLASMLLPDRRGYESHIYRVSPPAEKAAMAIVARAFGDPDLQIKREALRAAGFLHRLPAPDEIVPAITEALQTREGRQFASQGVAYLNGSGSRQQKDALIQALQAMSSDADAETQKAVKRAVDALMKQPKPKSKSPKKKPQ